MTRAPVALPPFPARTGDPATPAALAARGLHLRHAHAGDLDWLVALYADTRRDEMAVVPWPAGAKAGFLADQFALQHRHYVAHYPDADFLVVESGRTPLGRFYLHRGDAEHLVVDISLFAAHRGQGIGGQLVAAAQDEAARAGRGVTLSVLDHNLAARRLYARLGFAVTGQDGMYLAMRWSPGPPAGTVS